MYSQIVDSVIGKLKVIFPEKSIVSGPIKEGEKESCIAAGISQVSEKCVNGNRYCCSIGLFVNYHPDTEESYQDQYHVLELLMEHLEFVSTENGVSLGSVSRNGKFENEKMIFEAEYQMFFLKNKGEDMSMEDMKLK